MQLSVLGLHRPRVVTFHYDNEDVRRGRARIAAGSLLEALIQSRAVLRVGINSSGSGPDITVRQKGPQPRDLQHVSFLPNRVTQCEKRIEHDFVAKRVAGRPGIFHAYQSFPRPNPQTDERPYRHQTESDHLDRSSPQKSRGLGGAGNTAQFAEKPRADGHADASQQNQPHNWITLPNRAQDRVAIVID